MKKFFNDHPIISSIVLSIIASVIYELWIAPIIDGFQKLKSLEISIGFSLKEKLYLFPMNLISILFYVIIVTGLVIYITYHVVHNKIKKSIKEVLPNSFYCDKCKDMDSLTQENSVMQKKYDDLLTEYQSALPYKKLTDCLNNFFDNTEVLESIQLFSAPKLPAIEDANLMNEIKIQLKFIDGKAKSFSNTNALFNINYIFEKSIYYDVKKLFDSRNYYYSANGRQRDPNTEKDIQEKALGLFDKIRNHLDNIKNISDIDNTHYACYKLLEILANVVIGDKSIINCDKMLQLEDIEKQLKYGQRTGMLGAIFTENLYCFYNENSLTKKDRMYFSVPISYKNEQLILLGICNKNALKVTTNCDYVKCCENIYEDIRKALSKMEV